MVQWNPDIFWTPFFEEQDRFCHGDERRVQRKYQENCELRKWLNRLDTPLDARQKARAYFENICRKAENVYDHNLIDLFESIHGISIWEVIEKHFPTADQFLEQELPELRENCCGRFS